MYHKLGHLKVTYGRPFLLENRLFRPTFWFQNRVKSVAKTVTNCRHFRLCSASFPRLFRTQIVAISASFLGDGKVTFY